MKNEDINKLVEQLMAIGTLASRRVGKSIESQQNKTEYDVRRDGNIRRKIDQKLMKLFTKFIDKKSVERLQEIQNTQNQIIDRIFDESGWIVSRDGAIYEDNFTNQGDPEFASHDTYRLNRNGNGFSIASDENPFNQYFAMIKEGEMSFLKKYQKSLNKLHSLMTEEEKIMLGNYTLTNPNVDSNTMNLIAEYLGYEDKTKSLGTRVKNSL